MFSFFKKKAWKSENFGERAQGQAPSMLLIHYTGMETSEAALEHLCDPASEVSAHYVIEESGALHALVPDEKRAWHAGQSYWAGDTDINSASIGIELVNPGAAFGYQDFPLAQMKRLEALTIDLIGKYDIAASRVLGHSDVAPGRKIDPGEKFPWEALAARGIGLWPKPEEMDYQAAEDIILSPERLQELLVAYGYNPEVPFETLITEFHRHFYPDKFLGEAARPEEPDILSAAKVLSLIRQAQKKA